MPEFDVVMEFPAMHVGVRTEGKLIGEICFLPTSVPLCEPKNALSEKTASQFRKYLKNPRFRFKLPHAERGTAFQRRVWGVIETIPSGRTLTYGQVARQLRTGPRPVGQACGANWFPLLVPCHRVLGSGSLGGFGNHGEGFHLEIKRWLLEHEKAI
jgi:methylated-DNA-[protein]-cysteine S-methyltransferase